MDKLKQCSTKKNTDTSQGVSINDIIELQNSEVAAVSLRS
jgi:hypothetical protein